MFNDLDKSLKTLLEQELPELVKQVTISFETLDTQASRDDNAVNVFIYGVRETWERRDES